MICNQLSAHASGGVRTGPPSNSISRGLQRCSSTVLGGPDHPAEVDHSRPLNVLQRELELALRLSACKRGYARNLHLLSEPGVAGRGKSLW
ncbi:uncharacterized protein TRAVEDRAFT_56877 [Trametes versicolor FP-101664 SS1]|uniref:uncharacterized protein n=1 Tax=Trametes versicolor (strain FP-101664) TaxID=717944 RepID=UPI00046249DF|nr:uncharacterized protein TRAVEDRAFT_56877 [Trametes versicolor FP-101664 SS1]EIW61610.1 hypothetical protein TRAVEDRAFT_56877 [Trametes versicolor FP-101664 SS1]